MNLNRLIEFADGQKVRGIWSQLEMGVTSYDMHRAACQHIIYFEDINANSESQDGQRGADVRGPRSAPPVHRHHAAVAPLACADCLQRARRSQEAESAELFQEDPECAGPRHDLPAAPGWRVRERDVNTVRPNTETFNGKGSFIGRVARHIAWRFQQPERPPRNREMWLSERHLLLSSAH
jgi:hypothetical protein